MKKSQKIRFTLRVPEKLYKKIQAHLDNLAIYKPMNSFFLECATKQLQKKKLSS